jgi:uncharacterized protein
MDGRPWRERPGGVSLTVRVTPRGGRDSVDGREVLADGKAVLKIRVRSAPEDGAANDAVRRLIAKTVARPASAVRMESGATSRVKVLTISGDPTVIGMALEQAIGSGKEP